MQRNMHTIVRANRPNVWAEGFQKLNVAKNLLLKMFDISRQLISSRRQNAALIVSNDH